MAVCIVFELSLLGWGRLRVPVLTAGTPDVAPVRAALLMVVVMALAAGRTLPPSLGDLERSNPVRLLHLRAGHWLVATTVLALVVTPAAMRLGWPWAAACAANALGLLGLAAVSTVAGVPYWCLPVAVPGVTWMFGTETVADVPRPWAWTLVALPHTAGIAVNALLWFVGSVAWVGVGPRHAA
jgi:hypothetical protein